MKIKNWNLDTWMNCLLLRNVLDRLLVLLPSNSVMKEKLLMRMIFNMKNSQRKLLRRKNLKLKGRKKMKHHLKKILKSRKNLNSILENSSGL
jgi:hypothetical protein